MPCEFELPDELRKELESEIDELVGHPIFREGIKRQLISIEGPPGCGKTLLRKELQKTFERNEIPCLSDGEEFWLDNFFPYPSTAEEDEEELLKKMNKYCERAKNLFVPYLEKGYVVITESSLHTCYLQVECHTFARGGVLDSRMSGLVWPSCRIENMQGPSMKFRPTMSFFQDFDPQEVAKNIRGSTKKENIKLKASCLTTLRMLSLEYADRSNGGLFLLGSQDPIDPIEYKLIFCVNRIFLDLLCRKGIKERCRKSFPSLFKGIDQ